jgi:hypothetical protein
MKKTNDALKILENIHHNNPELRRMVFMAKIKARLEQIIYQIPLLAHFHKYLNPDN